MNISDAFPTDYNSARSHFRQLSQQLTDNINVYPVGSSSEDLSIDVTTLGEPGARRKVIVSSGLHGIEGFLGSAIQAAVLNAFINRDINLAGYSVVLIHAINPYGFKHLRRVNEDNIDLNRNFLMDFNKKPSAKDYAKFNKLLNPQTEIRNIDIFTLKAYLYICRYGVTSLRHSIAAGQYDFPKGLFFGGDSAAQSTKLIQQILLSVSAGENKIFHVDIHSGLGKYADYKLLLSKNDQFVISDRYTSIFNSAKIEKIGEHGGISSVISGTISDYFSSIIGENYHHLGLEFGTYSNLKLLKAMRLENAAHHYRDDTDGHGKRIKAAFLECFCPADSSWRTTVISQGLTVINQAIAASLDID